MTKQDIAQALFEGQKLESKAQAERIVEGFLSEIVNGLKTDGEVSLHGFGVFKVKRAGERKGINPLTGAGITISARNKLSFRAGSKLKNAIQ